MTADDELAALKVQYDALKAERDALIKERDYLLELLDSTIARLVKYKDTRS